MAQQLMIIMVVATLIGGIIYFSQQQNTKGADHEVTNYQAKTQAREIAVTGLNLSLRKLADDKEEWADGEAYSVDVTEYGNGTFQTTVIPVGTSGDTVDVVSEGYVKYISTNGTPRDTLHVIEARYKREFAGGNERPKAFDYTVMTDKWLQIPNNILISTLDEAVNADIHTNGRLWTSSHDFEVQGYGTYGTISSATEANFIPNVDHNGPAANVYAVDEVPLPGLNLDGLRDAATLYYDAGDLTIDGDTLSFSTFGEWAAALGKSAGTETNPFVIFSEDDLVVQNLFQVSGYGIMVAAKNIRTEGVNKGIIGDVVNNETTLALMAGKTIRVDDEAHFSASMYASDYVVFWGTPTLTGSIISDRLYYRCGGTPQFIYAPPGCGVLNPGISCSGDPVGMTPIAYSEW